MTRGSACVVASLLLTGAVACAAPSEAPRVDLPVVVDASGAVPVTTDLGYAVELSSARIAIEDLVFTVAGEVHAESVPESSPGGLVHGLLIPMAHAHPGHYQGGEVTGELLGAFVVDWPADEGRELGVATLIATTYSAANFGFGRGSAEGLDAEDPLVGHTAIVSGSATKDGVTTAFTIVVDSPEDRELVGAPFDASLDEDAAGTLALRFNTADALEGDTLFDGLDFAALDADGDGELVIQPDAAEAELAAAYDLFRRTLQTHDHYAVELQN